jgi:DNA-binding Lrp family transcriptional regulator
MSEIALDAIDRTIINRLQSGFPVCERPYAEAAEALGIDEADLIARLQRLLDANVLTRFGPLYQIERAGGAVVLAAMQVAPEELERVAAIVNSRPEVAHNYLREHRFNLWFVLAAQSLDRVDRAQSWIETQTGYPVYAMPKLREYFLELRLPV